MKWVKVAIGAVIAILSVSIIATSVYDMTQETLILSERADIITGQGVATASPNIMYSSINFYEYLETIILTDKIEKGSIHLEYNGQNGDFIVTLTSIIGVANNNNISIIYNGVEYTDYLKFSNVFNTTNNGYSVILGYSSTSFSDVFGFEYEIGDTLTLYEQDNYTIPPQLTGISATLILLTPLIFAGGVLTYLLNKQNY